jgi:hypothetical protein
MTHTLVAAPRDGIRLGVGQDQYLAADPDDTLITGADIDGDSCAGAVRMTLVQADDDAVAETIWLSQRRIGVPYTVSVGEIGLADVFVGPEFSLAIPEGWTAAGCPGSFIAIEPDGRANVRIGREQSDLALAEYVDEQIVLFQDPEEEFTNWALESRRALILPGGLQGEKIVYTWSPPDNEVRQTQVYAQSGGTFYFLTFTTTQADTAAFEQELDLLLGYLRLGASTTVVPAACATCDGVATLARQANLDELAATMDVVDDLHCSDATDDAEAGARARIRCSFPGGFVVDFALWASVEEFQAFVDLFEAVPDALLQDWFLRGTGTARTGSTVEWVDEEGDARFFWTYDDLLITANAVLGGDDQERLNNWWGTSGALVRE